MGEPEKIEKTKRSVAGSVVSSGMDKSITVVGNDVFPILFTKSLFANRHVSMFMMKTMSVKREIRY